MRAVSPSVSVHYLKKRWRVLIQIRDKFKFLVKCVLNDENFTCISFVTHFPKKKLYNNLLQMLYLLQNLTSLQIFDITKQNAEDAPEILPCVRVY